MRLEREGSDLAAYTCWMHGVEVRHSPYVLASNTESELFPLLVKMPCCAGDCQLILEGSNSSSPAGGCGAAAESSCHQMWRRAMLGTITTSIRTGWISPSLRPTPTTPRPLTCMVPQDMYGLQLRCAGDAGQVGLAQLGAWRHQGWLDSQSSGTAQMGTSCILARGATSYGRPDGWPQRPSPRRSLAADGSA